MKYKGFNPVEPAVSPTTEQIYKSKKHILSYVGASLKQQPEFLQKYYADMQEFCDGYESGMIKNWKEYFMTAEETVRSWAKLTLEQYKERVKKLHDQYKRNERP